MQAEQALETALRRARELDCGVLTAKRVVKDEGGDGMRGQFLTFRREGTMCCCATWGGQTSWKRPKRLDGFVPHNGGQRSHLVRQRLRFVVRGLRHVLCRNRKRHTEAQ